MIFQILNNIITHGLNQWRNTKGRKTRDGSVPRKYLPSSFILTGKAFTSDMMFSLKVKSWCNQSEKQSVHLCFHWSSVRAAKGQHRRILKNDHLFWIINFYLMAAYGLITTCKGRIANVPPFISVARPQTFYQNSFHPLSKLMTS